MANGVLAGAATSVASLCCCAVSQKRGSPGREPLHGNGWQSSTPSAFRAEVILSLKWTIKKDIEHEERDQYLILCTAKTVQ